MTAIGLLIFFLLSFIFVLTEKILRMESRLKKYKEDVDKYKAHFLDTQKRLDDLLYEKHLEKLKISEKQRQAALLRLK